MERFQDNISYYPNRKYTLFFISNTFISNNPKAELLVFEKHSLSSSSLSSKTNRAYSKIYAKNNYLCFNEVIRLIIMNVKTKKKLDYIHNT